MKKSVQLLTTLFCVTGAPALSAACGDSNVCNCIAGDSACAENNGWGFYFTGEALAWKAQQAGLEFAVESRVSGTPDGKNLIPEPEYDWGFRLGLGYVTCHDAWDIYIDWAHFHTNFHKNATGTTGTLTETLSSVNPNNDGVTSASSDFTLTLDMADLELGRAFYVSNCLILRPSFGIRGVQTKENSDVTYLGRAGAGLSPDFITFINDFWGVGPRAALNSNWKVGYGFSLYGNAAASFPLGGYSNLSVVETTGPAPLLRHHVSDDYGVGKFIFDIQLGFRWNKLCFKDCSRVGLFFGWESHFFSNLWQWQTVTFSPTPNGDLNVSGFNLSACIDF